MNNPGSPAPTLLDLRQYETEAAKLLPQVRELKTKSGKGWINVRMRPIDCERFTCPLLIRTLSGKTSVKGIMVLQDWYNASQTLKSAEDYITNIARGLDEDSTLTPLFGSASCWRKALEDREGWLATNAVWGVRPHYVKPSGYLGHETHQAGFLTWGNIVKELLLKYNPRLKKVLAGDWAKVATIGIDAVVPASRFFRA